MIANTYVVKPFGISEVKVIALKGEPGGPTQEQVNTAVEEYMDDHPEAQIPDGAVTTEKLASNAVAPYADNLVSSSYVSDSEPYLFRKTFAGVREDTEIVGGSIVWNQLLDKDVYPATQTINGITFTNNGDGTITVNGTATAQAEYSFVSSFPLPYGHKALMMGCPSGGSASTYALLDNYQSPVVRDVGNGIIYRINTTSNRATARIRVLSGVTVSNLVFKPQTIDLTLMFGPTIADYIYAQEQATAGAGVAFFRSLFDKPYYAYNAGTLMSVNTSAHKMVGKNLFDEEYPNIHSSMRYRAIYVGDGTFTMSTTLPLVSGSANLFFLAGNVSSGASTSSNGVSAGVSRTVTAIDGYVTVAYRIINNENQYSPVNYSTQIERGSTATAYEPYTSITYPLSSIDLRGIPTIVDGKLKYDGDVRKSGGTVERRYGYRAYQSGDESLANAITDGTHTVYKLTTATTETADPYTNPQVCYPNGTEEYIDTRDVPIPVGHNTKYMRDLKKLLEGIPDAPAANGTYVLKATVSSSGVTYAWVEG